MSNRQNGTVPSKDDHVIDKHLSAFDSHQMLRQMLRLRLIEPEFVPLVQKIL